MNIHIDTNGPIPTAYHYQSDKVTVNIDGIVAAVAKLNNKILRLRDEIDAFKNENKIHSDAARNCSRPAPAGFNDSTENEKRRTSARYELQKDFKGDDSAPGGIDLSARLSFAKRAREEVKATNEAAVFKEDYPRDDKSIENDERSNRSRVSKPSKPSRTYRRSISDAEKSGKEIGERRGNVRVSSVIDEKSQPECSECRDELVNVRRYCDCGPGNVIATKIKRKRISRGVQHDVPNGYRGRSGCFSLSCFKPKSNTRNYSSVRTVFKSSVKKKFGVIRGSPNEVNESLVNEILSNDTRYEEESRNTIKKRKKFVGNADPKKEELRRVIDTSDGGKQEEDGNPRNGEAKVNRLGKLRPNKVLALNNDSKTRQKEPCYDSDIVNGSQNNKKKIARSGFETNGRTSDDGERKNYFQDGRDVKLSDRKADSDNVRGSAAANSDVRRRKD